MRKAAKVHLLETLAVLETSPHQNARTSEANAPSDVGVVVSR